jgi:hypothetical protein
MQLPLGTGVVWNMACIGQLGSIECDELKKNFN